MTADVIIIRAGISGLACTRSIQARWCGSAHELASHWMGPFHEGREWLQRDEVQRSIGIAMQTLMLVAQDLGYDSCPMIGFDIDKVAELINLPEDHVMGPMVAIGKGIKDPWPKPAENHAELAPETVQRDLIGLSRLR